MKDIKTTDRSDDSLMFQVDSKTTKEHMNKLESFGIDVGVSKTTYADKIIKSAIQYNVGFGEG
ncbi:hypothetical protein rtp8 [Escherichia phage Rtp]|uniref:Uncharacterized protein n=1 Tax=Escherichia phage Rtp TaxID=2994041 RepID=Q333H6_9CAUD|nr:hypothetical protein rtp8 [Escherichia phage Rtp]CAJ42212.1 hypothetical protein [Escherichia phage Rtp]